MDSEEDSESDSTQPSVINSIVLPITNKYSGGRIVRIKLINFMVYDNVEIFPGPGLNLIIGPNGSGKSTMVCGICLGLAGKASFTGRKMRIVDYIKHRKDQATIEIELDDPNKKKNIVIRRTIPLTGNSQYAIDNHTVKENAVEKEVARFNIQMNNLCQFLPQERVSEFCKMNTVQLLESMQQAVGDENLFKSHNELKNLRNGCRELESEISSKANNITSEKKKNERIETEAQIYAEIQTLNKRKALLKEQIPLLRYRETHGEMLMQKKRRQKLKAKEKNFQESLDPIRNELKLYKNNITQYNNELEEKSKSFTSCKKNVSYLLDQISTIEDKINEAYADLELKIQEQQKSEERMRALETQLKSHVDERHVAQQEVINLEKEQGNIQAEIEKNTNLIHETDVKLDNIRLYINKNIYQKQDYEKDLQKLSGIEHKKLEVLKKLDNDTYKAVVWLRDNRHKFKKQVFDPILLMVDVPPPHIKYIENHIGFRDLIAFVCEDKEDSQLLVEILRNEKKWAINTVLAPPRKPSEFQPRISNNELKSRYFFLCYLKDMFKAPGPIVSFLCATYKIQNTPVGDETTEKHLNEIINTNKFSRFYTTDNMYTVRHSRYGAQNVSIANSVLRPPQIISTFTNTSDQQIEIAKKLKENDCDLQTFKKEQQQLQAKRQEYNETLEVLRRKKKTYADAKTACKSIDLLISQKEKSLEAIRKLCTDVAKLTESMEDFVAKKKKEKVDRLEEIKLNFMTSTQFLRRIVQLHFYSFAISKKESIAAGKLIEEEELYKNLEAQCQEAEQKYIRLKQLAIQQLKEASLACGIEIKESTLPVLEERYGSLPHTIEEVQSEIHKIIAKICCFGQSDKAVYDEHQRRKNEILKSVEDLENLKLKLEHMKNEMERTKEAWLTPLNALIAKISNTFSRYFQSLGCAGELGLKISDNPDDFDKYGLSIQVKFRDESPLQELSHAHHSGGECSVSTIIFILALQKLTEVPFRCVDEINQGMDSINERRIFELVAMSSGISSQYFLLTPKLLPGLTYPKEMKVHIIKNAPALDENINWKIDSIIDNLQRSNRKR